MTELVAVSECNDNFANYIIWHISTAMNLFNINYNFITETLHSRKIILNISKPQKRALVFLLFSNNKTVVFFCLTPFFIIYVFYSNIYTKNTKRPKNQHLVSNEK